MIEYKNKKIGNLYVVLHRAVGCFGGRDLRPVIVYAKKTHMDLVFVQDEREFNSGFERVHSKRPAPFTVGDLVRKVGGSYSANGTIRAAFLTRDGNQRYVFEFDEPQGMLHIFNHDQLQLRGGGNE